MPKFPQNPSRNLPERKISIKAMLDKFGLESFNRFLSELQLESDRGAAVVGPAFLEDSLRTLIASFLIREEKPVNDLLGTEKKPGILRGLKATATTAYCLGLLGRNEFDDVEKIGAIRNRFAHHLHGLSFADSSIKSMCDKLKWPDILARPGSSEDDPRSRFDIAITILAGIIRTKALDVERERRSVAKGFGIIGGKK